MMKRVPGIVFSTISLFIVAILFIALVDNNFFSKIIYDDEGTSQRDTVFYKREGNFFITNNGSINFYEPGKLECSSFSRSPFSIGTFVSNSEGVLNQVEASGYMKLKGKMVVCRFSSVSDRPLPYSVFYGYSLSSLIRLGIAVSCVYLLYTMFFSIFHLHDNTDGTSE